ncbi:MAG: hypothetical protein GY825_07660, partial [Phycisphaeraceae bacterium]|nr:hypothetical protein [Phycisphaeraceae bacterium]
EEQTDGDGDGVGDNGDPFPEDPSEWSDRAGDGTGDNTDPFPNDPTEWADVDNDGLGNNEDPDDDNDGLSDLEEELPGEDCVVSAPRRADTDGDGIADGVDLYPNDPFPEFMLRRADRRIELYLSNRDGSFGEAVLIGEEIEHEGRPLQYQGFAVGDFDGNGVMDFLASTSPLVEGEPTHRVYHFVRDTKADEFIQIDLGLTDIRLGGIIVDADADLRFDLAWFEQERAGNVAGGRLWVHLNNYPPLDQCVAGGPEDGCFFIRQPALDLTGTVGGQWIARMALQAVNLDPEAGDTPDLTLTTYASGGNAPTRVYSLAGNGDGTFQPPVERFVHNGDRRLAPANTVMFADFNVDGVGDVLLGFDDDGRPGEAWTYFGIGDGTEHTLEEVG